MDTVKITSELDPVLQNSLRQLIAEFAIASIFYYPTDNGISQLLIVLVSKLDVKLVESKKWIASAYINYGLFIHVTDEFTLKSNLSIGNPFSMAYCRKPAVLYSNADGIGCSDASWSSCKKKYRQYTERFHHDHDLLFSESSRMKKYSSQLGTVLILNSVFEYDIFQLEQLYFGRNLNLENLHQSINRLILVEPELASLFVRKNENEFFLIGELERAVQCAEEDEDYFNDDLVNALIECESKLYHLVSKRFSELKKSIKTILPEHSFKLMDYAVDEDEQTKIVSQILHIKPVEEIYLFNKRIGSAQSVYYFLLVGEGLGSVVLNSMQQCVTAKLGGNVEVVIIGHSRIWIQKNLFQHQAFLKEIMQPENRVYQAAVYPQIHWEDPHVKCYPDLEYYFRSAKVLYESYLALRKNGKKNSEGAELLFNHTLMRVFRTLVFSKSSYLPNYATPFILWKLIVHLEPELEKVEFLFDKYNNKNFFGSIKHRLQFNHDFARTSKKNLKLMDEILVLLVGNLTQSVNSALSTS